MHSAKAAAPLDDLQMVRAALQELLATGRTDEALDTAIALLGQLRDQNSDLMLRLAAMRRRQHRSEKIDPKQLALLLAGDEPEGEPTESGESATDDDLEAELEAVREENRQQQPRKHPA